MLWKGFNFKLTTTLRKRLKVSLPQAHSVLLSLKFISPVSHSWTWCSLENWLDGSSRLPGSYFCFNGGLGTQGPFSNWGCVIELQAGFWVTELSSLLPPFFAPSFLSADLELKAPFAESPVLCLGFPAGSSGKEPAHQCRRRHERCGLDPWVGKIPWRKAWQPTPVFLPGESRG